jgi:predicted O-methyltransferase YrrM
MERINLLKDYVSKENGIFVEIGTESGNFAEALLNFNKTATLYCIDPYEKYVDYKDSLNLITGDKRYEDTYNRLKNQFGDRVILIRKYSDQAIPLIPNNIDFLYIDGNHAYKYVKSDLENYYSKVNPGGYIVGDDAIDIDDSQRNSEGNCFFSCNSIFHNIGVIYAFREFLNKNNLKAKIITNQIILQKPV